MNHSLQGGIAKHGAARWNGIVIIVSSAPTPKETPMADINVQRSHHLGLKGAHAAAAKMSVKLGKQFGLSGKWEGNTLHFDRPGVSGFLTISDHDVKLEVTLGFLLKAMKAPIERAVHRDLDEVLAAPEKPPSRASARPKPTEKKATGAPKKSS
jgi:putative polyhydroxyalkanoate system protein